MSAPTAQLRKRDILPTGTIVGDDPNGRWRQPARHRALDRMMLPQLNSGTLPCEDRDGKTEVLVVRQRDSAATQIGDKHLPVMDCPLTFNDEALSNGTGMEHLARGNFAA
jgi:hypothetical protein